MTKINPATSKILGVVFCGGQSTRMGSDKGLLVAEGSTWANAAADKFKALPLPFAISVNPTQADSYLAIFEESQLVQDNPRLQVNGPLAGLLSVHLQYPSHDLLVLACDMPFMDVGVMKHLIKTYEEHQAEACVFTNNEEPEPFCAIYSARGLASILEQLQVGLLQKHSMKYVLEQLQVTAIPLKADQLPYFRNINAHAELNGL